MGKSNTALMGKSLTEISEATGISLSYLSLILSGKKNVSLTVLARIGETLGISIEDVQLLISQQIKSTLPKKVKPARSNIEQREIIEQTLTVLQKNFDNQMLNQLKSRVREKSSSDFPLKECYLFWMDGIIASKCNEYQEALNYLGKASKFKAVTSGEKRMLARIYVGLGSIYIGLSDYKMALKMLKRSLNLWSKGNEAAVAYLNLGTLYRRNRKYSSAIRAYTFSRDLGQSYIKNLAYSGLGQIYIDLNNMPLARSVLLEGYVFSKKNTEKWGCQDICCNLGEYYKYAGQLQRAEYILKKGLKYAQKLNGVRAKDFIRLEIAEVYLLQNREKEAVQIFNEMSAEVSKSGDLLLLGSTFLSCAKKYLSTSYYEEALQYLNKSYLALSGIGPTLEILECCKLLLECHSRKHNSAEVQFYKDEMRKMKSKLKSKMSKK